MAAGDGRCTRYLLHDKFDIVDCFDQCPEAVKNLEMLRTSIREVDLVDQFNAFGAPAGILESVPEDFSGPSNA